MKTKEGRKKCTIYRFVALFLNSKFVYELYFVSLFYAIYVDEATNKCFFS